MKFSEKYGYQSKPPFQIEDMDEHLRMDIWNILYVNFFYEFNENGVKSNFLEIASKIWNNIFRYDYEIFCNGFDIRINNQIPVFIKLKNSYFKLKWFEIYDLIEIILKNYFENLNLKKEFTNQLNECFERNNAAYRIVNTKIIRITEKCEIYSIEESSNNPHDSVQKHMNKSLNHFSDRENPDYENCVKESISAVESLCKIILKENGIKSDDFTLGHALNEMSKSEEINLNEDFKDGFKNLFHFTSSTDGMRHGGIEEGNVNFDLAKLMLVTCSAFINYLQTSYL